MGYQQFHALITAILLAGNFANSEFANDNDNAFNLEQLARTAKEIMDGCGFVRKSRVSR